MTPLNRLSSIAVTALDALLEAGGMPPVAIPEAAAPD